LGGSRGGRHANVTSSYINIFWRNSLGKKQGLFAPLSGREEGYQLGLQGLGRPKSLRRLQVALALDIRFSSIRLAHLFFLSSDSAAGDSPCTADRRSKPKHIAIGERELPEVLTLGEKTSATLRGLFSCQTTSGTFKAEGGYLH
jgi:hypothetical protein